jgi:acyl carrier protein
MDELRTRLIGCFETVFPELPASEIPSASQARLANWDSVAAITLLNMVEEEFGFPVDLDRLGELNSFQQYLDLVESETRSRLN